MFDQHVKSLQILEYFETNLLELKVPVIRFNVFNVAFISPNYFPR